MARTEAGVYTTGEKGRNRVSVFRRGRLLYLRWYDGAGRQRKQALSHRNVARAKADADKLAASMQRGDVVAPTVRTLAGLFDKYLADRDRLYERKELTRNAWRHGQKVWRIAEAVWGRSLDPLKLTQEHIRDYCRYRQAAGSLARNGTQGRPLGGRILEQDVDLLRAACNWAVSQTPPLLPWNPVRIEWMPKAGQPNQVHLEPAEIQAMLTVAPQVHRYAALLVALCYETGHRIGAVRQLHWDDVNLVSRTIHWRAGQDKSKFDHYTPLVDELLPVLGAHPVREGPLFPAERRGRGRGLPGTCMSREAANGLFTALEAAAGLPPLPGRGWHSFRRVFANELRAEPLKDVASAGGWKSTKTLVDVYLKTSIPAMRDALKGRKRSVSPAVVGLRLVS